MGLAVEAFGRPKLHSLGEGQLGRAVALGNSLLGGTAARTLQYVVAERVLVEGCPGDAWRKWRGWRQRRPWERRRWWCRVRHRSQLWLNRTDRGLHGSGDGPTGCGRRRQRAGPDR